MWIISAWQRISPKVIVKFCVSNAVDEVDVICCGMAVKRIGILGVSVRKMKAPSVKMETVTLIGKGR